MTSKPTLIPELKVMDFQESFKFYTQLVGFEVLYERPEEDFAMLVFNGAQLMIEGLTDKSRLWDVGKLEGPLGRGVNFQIQVHDVRNLYQKFNEVDYPIFLNMEEKWYRANNKEVGNMQFLVQDPDGYLLRFFEDMGTR